MEAGAQHGRRGTFAQFARRRPRPWQRIVCAVLPFVLANGMWDERGPVLAAVTFVFYGALLLPVVLGREPPVAWSRRHPVLDLLLLVPLVALALAHSTDVSLPLCAVIGVAAWLLLAALRLLQRRRRRALTSTTATTAGP